MAEILVQERKGVVVNITISVDSIGFSDSANDSYAVDRGRVKFVVHSLIKNGVPGESITGGVIFNNEKNLIIESEVERDVGSIEGENNEPRQ